MIISNDFELRRFIPNVMSTVEGEGSIYEKIEPYMGLVEASLSDIFIGPEMLANPRSMPEALRNAASVYVANEAFRMAVPSLDLVLTPNGFGIVNNQNVVPASKERIERLMFSLAQMRDKAVSTMVIALADIDGYAETPQGEWFSSSLFLPLAGHLSGLVDPEKPMWDEYLRIRNIAEPLENEAADEFISPELMTRLRAAPFEKGSGYARLAGRVRRVIAGAIPGSPLDKRALTDLVNFIRENPDKYPEWHASRTAGLFDPPVFGNDKKSSGYWF